jgi:hypothetical protein
MPAIAVICSECGITLFRHNGLCVLSAKRRGRSRRGKHAESSNFEPCWPPVQSFQKSCLRTGVHPASAEAIDD